MKTVNTQRAEGMNPPREVQPDVLLFICELCGRKWPIPAKECFYTMSGNERVYDLWCDCQGEDYQKNRHDNARLRRLYQDRGNS